MFGQSCALRPPGPCVRVTSFKEKFSFWRKREGFMQGIHSQVVGWHIIYYRLYRRPEETQSDHRPYPMYNVFFVFVLLNLFEWVSICCLNSWMIPLTNKSKPMSHHGMSLSELDSFLNLHFDQVPVPCPADEWFSLHPTSHANCILKLLNLGPNCGKGMSRCVGMPWNAFLAYSTHEKVVKTAVPCYYCMSHRLRQCYAGLFIWPIENQ